MSNKMTLPQTEVLLAAEHLIRVAKRNGYTVLGFVVGWGPSNNEPLFSSVSTLSSPPGPGAFETLCKARDEKIRSGMSDVVVVRELN